ncbi:hypothetical protein Ate02nite_11160 [Paractinoplanes tereljensis]|uniref:Uncharacterized protein n=1 Tax=Paractinoplanes tereljensis TaxID=571912 RepID=A0A919NI30_9ACTN|nr:hypothetical protein Ate02nite_11160 [Actinoplanes tereljensis]
MGETVGDDRALQRDHRPAVPAGTGHVLAVLNREVSHDTYVTAPAPAADVGPLRREVSDLLVGACIPSAALGAPAVSFLKG